jgi:hypothetical protein
MKRSVVLVMLLVAACASGDGAAPTPEVSAAPVSSPAHPPDVELIWEAGAEMPTPRTEVAVARNGPFVVAAGGFTADGQASDVVEAYNFRQDTWRTLTPLPEHVHHAALASAGGQLYLIGGYLADGSASTKVWINTLDGRAWREGPPLPRSRGAMGYAVVDGYIHVVGGANVFRGGSRLSEAHDIYDVSEREWSKGADLPEPRDHLAAAAVGDRLYVLGGRKLSLDTNSARVDVYAGGRWTRLPDMPTARGGFAVAGWDGYVFVFGGERPDGTIAPVEFYDPAAEEWRAGPDLPTPRHGMGAVAFDADRIVVPGGGPQPGLSVSGATEMLVLPED